MFWVKGSDYSWKDRDIHVPRSSTPFGQHQESQLLWRSNFLYSIVILSYSQPIRFVSLDFEYVQSDRKSVNCGLPVLNFHRGCDAWCWPKGAQPLEMRMGPGRSWLRVNKPRGEWVRGPFLPTYCWPLPWLIYRACSYVRQGLEPKPLCSEFGYSNHIGYTFIANTHWAITLSHLTNFKVVCYCWTSGCDHLW